MVSWLVKQALLNLADDMKLSVKWPATRVEWARLMHKLGVKGIHVAERDTQKTNVIKELGHFTNTWSAEGCLAECVQPAELGWGTHENNLPEDGRTHASGCKAAIYLDTPAATVRVKTWTPSTGSHFSFLITHNEAISIADYFTLKSGDEVIYRPTCHYAYRPSDITLESLDELIANNCKPQDEFRVLTADEITEGMEELGVLLYGHEKNAYWYGSQLTIDEARGLAPHQNATELQVSSALLTGVLWAIQHPSEGLVEAEEMDFEECLAIQKQYLGTVSGHYTDWNPSKDLREGEKLVDESDPWQFANIRIKEL